MTAPQTGDGPAKARRRKRSREERVAAVRERIAKATRHEERRLIAVARRAGFFEHRISSGEIARAIRNVIDARPTPAPSSLHRLKADLRRLGRMSRADDARRKALLGGFMVAQMRHKSHLAAVFRPDIDAYLAGHRNPDIAVSNIEFMHGFLNGLGPDAGCGSAKPSTADAANGIQNNRDQARRLILLGAWVLDRRKRLAKLDSLIQGELMGFLRQDRAATRNMDLLRDILGR